MKINIPLAVAATLLAALIICGSVCLGFPVAVTVMGGIFSLGTLLLTMGFDYSDMGHSAALKTISIAAFVIMLVVNVVLGILKASTPPVIIIDGICMVLFFIISWRIFKSQM